MAWDRMHPRLTARGSWLDHCGELPLIHGTLIRLKVEHLPGDRDPKPVWLWSSRTDSDAAHLDRLWKALLRRFDLEHTFRLFKQTLGWTIPKVRDPATADLWTWLIIAAHTQLRLARPLAADLRRPLEKPTPPDRLTPARVRRGFRHLRVKAARPAGAPRPSRRGPGRPAGSKNRRPAQRHEPGKTENRAETLTERSAGRSAHRVPVLVPVPPRDPLTAVMASDGGLALLSAPGGAGGGSGRAGGRAL
ncbi:hypothetical protein [Streptomyces sp. ISL-100]|uniref:hypothetical protein n=1 Tax=Streptomyces sp. ISL-100 TaxID=2819173 RepID=UPI0027E5B2B6|nr:hypothetical protein [Streptomyces sp. ISL-100]